jgi:hypothetical protein
MTDSNTKVYYAKSVSAQSSSLSLSSEYRNSQSGTPDAKDSAGLKPKFFHANDLKVKKSLPKNSKFASSKMSVRSISTHSPTSAVVRSSPNGSLRTQLSMINIRDDVEVGSISPTFKPRIPPASGLRSKDSNTSLNSANCGASISQIPQMTAAQPLLGAPLPTVTSTISSVPSTTFASLGPTVPTNKLAHTKELRAERKIMDLEISNASLLSINKYLERRLRKKTRDLEYVSSLRRDQTDLRYTDEGGSMPRVTETGTTAESNDFNFSSESEDDTVADEVVPDFDDESLLAGRKAEEIRRRTRVHIAFLESSQKVDHKLQHCLTMTESLLRDAQNSLNYEVDSSEIRLGGRVVEDDEDINDGENDSGLLEDGDETLT